MLFPRKKRKLPLPPPEKPKKVEGICPTIRSRWTCALVNVDVLVTQNGQFVPGA